MECNTPIVSISHFHRLTRFVRPCEFLRGVINYALETEIPDAVSLLSYLIIIHKLVIRACGKAIFGQHFGESVINRNNYFHLALRHCVFTDGPGDDIYQCNSCCFVSTDSDHYSLHARQGPFAAGHIMAQKALTDSFTISCILQSTYYLHQEATCKTCGQQFTIEDYEPLLHHAVNQHGHLLVPMTIKATWTADNVFVCAAKTTLSQRPPDATGALCTGCMQLFPTLTALQLHQEHANHGETSFICTICTNFYR